MDAMTDANAIRRMMLVVERLESATEQQARQLAEGMRQMQAAQREMTAARQSEEAKLKQAMVALFQEQQQKTESALRPAIGKAWRALIVSAVGLVLLCFGFFLLLNHEYRRLQDARARADAAEVSAEVRQASQHVTITSCGGRPCVLLNTAAPVWKSKGRDYVLVDGKGE